MKEGEGDMRRRLIVCLITALVVFTNFSPAMAADDRDDQVPPVKIETRTDLYKFQRGWNWFSVRGWSIRTARELFEPYGSRFGLVRFWTHQDPMLLSFYPGDHDEIGHLKPYFGYEVFVHLDIEVAIETVIDPPGFVQSTVFDKAGYYPIGWPGSTPYPVTEGLKGILDHVEAAWAWSSQEEEWRLVYWAGWQKQPVAYFRQGRAYVIKTKADHIPFSFPPAR